MGVFPHSSGSLDVVFRNDRVVKTTIGCPQTHQWGRLRLEGGVLEKKMGQELADQRNKGRESVIIAYQ